MMPLAILPLVMRGAATATLHGSHYTHAVIFTTLNPGIYSLPRIPRLTVRCVDFLDFLFFSFFLKDYESDGYGFET